LKQEEEHLEKGVYAIRYRTVRYGLAMSCKEGNWKDLNPRSTRSQNGKDIGSSRSRTVSSSFDGAKVTICIHPHGKTVLGPASRRQGRRKRGRNFERDRRGPGQELKSQTIVVVERRGTERGWKRKSEESYFFWKRGGYWGGFFFRRRLPVE